MRFFLNFLADSPIFTKLNFFDKKAMQAEVRQYEKNKDMSIEEDSADSYIFEDVPDNEEEISIYLEKGVSEEEKVYVSPGSHAKNWAFKLISKNKEIDLAVVKNYLKNCQWREDIEEIAVDCQKRHTYIKFIESKKINWFFSPKKLGNFFQVLGVLKEHYTRKSFKQKFPGLPSHVYKIRKPKSTNMSLQDICDHSEQISTQSTQQTQQTHNNFSQTLAFDSFIPSQNAPKITIKQEEQEEQEEKEVKKHLSHYKISSKRPAKKSSKRPESKHCSQSQFVSTTQLKPNNLSSTTSVSDLSNVSLFSQQCEQNTITFISHKEFSDHLFNMAFQEIISTESFDIKTFMAKQRILYPNKDLPSFFVELSTRIIPIIEALKKVEKAQNVINKSQEKKVYITEKEKLFF